MTFLDGVIVGACVVLIIEGAAWLIYLWTH
jgi:hypothetical protein